MVGCVVDCAGRAGTVSRTDIECCPHKEREEWIRNATNCSGMESRPPLFIVEPKPKISDLFYSGYAKGVAQITQRRRTVSETSALIAYDGKISREELARVPTPPATATHQPIPHHQIVEALVESLSFRQIGALQEEYAVSKDGMKMFGVLDLEAPLIPGCRFAIGIRNSHDKSMRLGLIIGVRVLVCMNMAFHGDFQPLLAKHSKSFSLVDAISVGVDRMQRNFGPMRRQVETWRAQQLTNATAKLIN